MLFSFYDRLFWQYSLLGEYVHFMIFYFIGRCDCPLYGESGEAQCQETGWHFNFACKSNASQKYYTPEFTRKCIQYALPSGFSYFCLKVRPKLYMSIYRLVIKFNASQKDFLLDCYVMKTGPTRQ